MLEDGTFNGKLLAINYALSVYGIWYSATAFAAGGWHVPTTWDEMLLLGEESAREGRALFAWADDAASYYQELAIASAIKEGGHKVRVALDNLAEGCWQHPAVTGVLAAMAQAVAEGYVVNGGPYLETQRLWASESLALMYPAGSWLAREVADVTDDTFGLTVAPVPALTSAPVLPAAAVHAAPTEQFIVPAAAANRAGAKELLRVMLSSRAATDFSRANLIPTVVRGTVPTDLTSTALQSQTRLLADAGEDIFSWRFVNHYGLTDTCNTLWASFLRGQLTATALAEQLQVTTDAVRNNPKIERYTVS